MRWTFGHSGCHYLGISRPFSCASSSVQYPPDVHTNTADTLSAVARTAPSALASQLASPHFISKLFKHVLSDPQSKSSLINALSVCITLLDPRRISAAAAAGQARGIQNLQPGTGGLVAAAPETVDGMLSELGEASCCLLAVI
jgi:serine/threonine-protein phosphatase 6 regulatory subunit 3